MGRIHTKFMAAQVMQRKGDTKGTVEDGKCTSTLLLIFYCFDVKEPGSEHSVKLFAMHFW